MIMHRCPTINTFSLTRLFVYGIILSSQGGYNMNDERRAFIAGLREAADYFEANPGTALYTGSGESFCSFPNSKAEFLSECANLGSFIKRWDDRHLTAVKEFSGGHTLKVFSDRGEFCTRVVRSVEVAATEAVYISARPAHTKDEVTWECPEDFSLLGEAK
jgi:hypothetical protein